MEAQNNRPNMPRPPTLLYAGRAKMIWFVVSSQREQSCCYLHMCDTLGDRSCRKVLRTSSCPWFHPVASVTASTKQDTQHASITHTNINTHARTHTHKWCCRALLTGTCPKPHSWRQFIMVRLPRRRQSDFWRGMGKMGATSSGTARVWSEHCASVSGVYSKRQA